MLHLIMSREANDRIEKAPVDTLERADALMYRGKLRLEQINVMKPCLFFFLFAA